ncbi:MAG: metallophosphoesterase [Elusimicrobiota bacterium]
MNGRRKNLKKKLSSILISVLLSCAAIASAAGKTAVIYGDTRTNAEMHRKITQAILKIKPEIVFHTGDLVNDGRNPGDWKVFNEISAPLRKAVKFYPVLGNHEHQSKIYFDSFKLPNNERWYSVDWNGIRFMMLDTESDIKSGSEQYNWLESELKKDKSKFRIIVNHHPAYTTGSHGDEQNLREKLVPLLEKYEVDMMFSGHNHCYERQEVNGIFYITTGGGGAPLHSQRKQDPNSKIFLECYNFSELRLDGNELSVTVYDDNMKVIDEFSKKK